MYVRRSSQMQPAKRRVGFVHKILEKISLFRKVGSSCVIMLFSSKAIKSEFCSCFFLCCSHSKDSFWRWKQLNAYLYFPFCVFTQILYQANWSTKHTVGPPSSLPPHDPTPQSQLFFPNFINGRRTINGKTRQL